jgi:hypothetical protein
MRQSMKVTVFAEDAAQNCKEQRTAEYRMSKGGIATLGLFYKTDRIPFFDIRYSLFFIPRITPQVGVSFSIKLAAFQASKENGVAS